MRLLNITISLPQAKFFRDTLKILDSFVFANSQANGDIGDFYDG